MVLLETSLTPPQPPLTYLEISPTPSLIRPIPPPTNFSLTPSPTPLTYSGIKPIPSIMNFSPRPSHTYSGLSPTPSPTPLTYSGIRPIPSITNFSPTPSPTYSGLSPTPSPTPLTYSGISPTPSQPPTDGEIWPTHPTRPSEKKSTLSIVVGICGGAIGLIIAVGIFVFFFFKRRNRRPTNTILPAQHPPKDESLSGRPYQHRQQSENSFSPERSPPAPPRPPPSLVSSRRSSPSPSVYSLRFANTSFTYEELAKATNDFSNANLLGQGGFGYVHKGVLQNGKEIAIKQLKVGSTQGEREFQAEVEIISRVHHRHLVSLVGYCISEAKRLLVYEFAPNNTLEFHLYGKGRPPLNWATRMKIALGSARGLAYLHEDCHPKIIHRDIKAANILLDYDFNAKVADFGLAKLTSDAETHISTRIMGTFGYLAPEYALTGKVTDKSDIFSFGVVLLELITGRRPVGGGQAFLDDNIVDWARPLLTQAMEDGNYDTLVDQKIQKDYDCNEMACMVACAAVCVRHLARRRPQMSQIVRALEGNLSLEVLNEGIRPGHSTVYNHEGSSNYGAAQYKEDLQRFKKMAFETQKPSDECSGPTSKFSTTQPSGSSSDGVRTTLDLGSSNEVQQNST